jgi:CDP-glucose 4,6-dehydratase
VALGHGTLEGVVMLPRAAFWRGKRVLLTGHTGFKGAWLSLWLQELGAHVIGISLPPSTQPSLCELLGSSMVQQNHHCDIRDAQATNALVQAARPDVVLHLAAQALVRTSYQQPLDTFATNVMGTAHVLDALRGLDSTRVVVAITTDKVYQNREWHYPYREDDALGGHDPYSASKAACEMVIAGYTTSFLGAQGVAVASARAGNVIGGGDWSADRLIPDAMRAWESGQTLHIRRPDAIRPWQHVLEPLAAYLVLAEKLWVQPSLAGAYNFGPHPGDAATVRQAVQLAQSVFPEGRVAFQDAPQGPHEAGLLTLEISKAQAALGIHPRWSLPQTVHRTMQWYLQQKKGESARTLCLADIADYEASA